MLKKITIFGFSIAFILALILFIFKFNYNNSIVNNSSIQNTELRIVSFSPSITEYIYTLKLDKYLIANTSYCNYPEDAKNKKKVGDFLNINYEYLISMGINTAIVQKEMQMQQDELTKLGIRVIVIDNSNIENILNAFNILGEAFDIEETANAERKKIEDKIKEFTSRIDSIKNKPRVLISVFRDLSNNKITNFFAAGSNNLYDNIISLLGAENVLKTKAIYPEISREGLINMDPDIIIDITHNEKQLRKQNNNWQEFSSVKAIQNNKVFTIPEKNISIPGPRIAEIIRTFYFCIYDE